MSSHTTTPSSNQPAQLHQTLVDHLVQDQYISSTAVEAAFRAVPRHHFLPDLELETVYSDEAIAIKEVNGRTVSSSSQPAMMAIMLEQLDLRPGQRVLEIGAGSGYNAALMACLVGPTGQVVTMDIDEDITTTAAKQLQAAGWPQVKVICDDGGLGYAPDAPYDRIILTVAAWDITPAWQEQLAPDGRLVLPLIINGLQKSIAFIPAGDHLISTAAHSCGFVSLRGAFAGPELIFPLGDRPGLEMGLDQPQAVDRPAMNAWLDQPNEDLPTAVTATPREIWNSLSLWLAAHEPALCTIQLTGDWLQQETVPCLFTYRGRWPAGLTTGILAETGLALLKRGPAPARSWLSATEPTTADFDTLFELVVRGYGDKEPAQRLRAQVIAWDAAGRPDGERIQIAVYPLDQEYAPSAGEVVLPKRWTQLVIKWPAVTDDRAV
jgi:protein-L-isoaspartate(D-aspartate) O-methyltransferase